MDQTAAPIVPARSTSLRLISIWGVALGTAATLVAVAGTLVGHFAIEIAATGAADVLARMI